MAPKSAAKGKADGKKKKKKTAPHTSGQWIPCTLRDYDLRAMEKEGLIAPRNESFWRVNPKETRLDLEPTEIVMMKSHVERGLSLPPSNFFSEVMTFYAVNPQHLPPNAIMTLSGFQALHEGYLGVRPTLELF